MKLKLVSFKLAKKLKEVGFDTPTIWYYHPNYGLSANSFCEQEEMDNMNGDNWAKGYYSAPELELANMWLRKVHNIHINLEPIINHIDSIVVGYCVEDIYTDDRIINGSDNTYSTKEEALEAGLLEACEILKNKKQKL